MKTLILASISAMLILTGCNTVKGFGQDVSKAGEGVTNTAEKVNEKL